MSEKDRIWSEIEMENDFCLILKMSFVLLIKTLNFRPIY